jgi:flavin-dependent dehydrogenase
MMIANRSYECLVIGAGPAGSTAAALVAEQGFSTLLVERDKLPRFHVGESLMPECYWVLERLGIVHELDRIGFTRQNGIQFLSGDESESTTFVYSEFDDRPSALSWHVNRAEFDQLLYDTAYNRGATCVEETRVVEIELRKKGHHKVVLQTADGKEQEISAKVVVDASGRSSLIASQIGVTVSDRNFRNAAIWGYFRNGARAGGSNPEVSCVIQTADGQGWFWYIPLFDGTVSVGLVAENQNLLRRGGGPQQTLETEIKNCPAVKRRLMDATQVGKINVAKDFSYRCNQKSGEGWVLVGDAAGFIDPIFFSGVFLALKSGQLAGEAVAEGLMENDLSPRQLGKWVADFDTGAQWIEKLAQAFYANPFRLGSFLKAHPEHHQNLTEILMGRLWQSDPGRVFADLDAWSKNIETAIRCPK